MIQQSQPLSSLSLLIPSTRKSRVRKNTRHGMNQSTHRSKNNFHKTLNISPCNPFANILVFSPLPKRPLIPSTAMTSRAALVYDTRVRLTWRYVFTTRRELETVSEITEAQKPMKACRKSFSANVVGGGSVLSR